MLEELHDKSSAIWSFVRRMRKMVSFKLDKEIQKDAFHLVTFLYQAYNLLPF